MKQIHPSITERFTRTTLLLLITLSLTAIAAYAQRSPYYFSYQVDSILAADSTAYKYQAASWNYSFTGNYQQVLEVRERQYSNTKAPLPSEEQKKVFKKYKAIDASAQIIKEASRTRLLIVNEAHHLPRHRVFLTSLLPQLRKQGYTYIGFEALDNNDTLLQTRKYPLLNSGYYTKEPCFGNLVRTALQADFHVFAYEQQTTSEEQLLYGREKAQAMSIKKLMDANPGAKFIIFCGYDHVVEDTLKNFMGLPMAGQLKQLTGINPFTVDQASLAEYLHTGSSYRALITAKRSVLFTDSAGNYFNKAGILKSIDCQLYHPPTRYVKGRPDWLIQQHTRLVQLHRKVTISYPCLIKVYIAGEDTVNAVPLDVIEIKDAADHKASMVMKGKKHVIIVENNKGEKQVITYK